MPERVVIGMSGGVDSSVAALLQQRAGFECVGLSLRLWDEHRGAAGRCCSPEDLADAARVAARLGIPHETVDAEAAFEEAVVRPFVRGYAGGRTPNPCVRCNDRVKFAELVRRADALGAAAIATGHYARVAREGGRWTLRRGRDRGKDQSYFLFGLSQEQLARSRFPVGDLTKEEVRSLAAEAGLPVASKCDSQDVCFVGEGGAAFFVEDRLREEGGGAVPGEIVHADGRLLGRHPGIHRFTIGQRRGLRVASPDGEPLYVVALDPARARVVVGPDSALSARAMECEGLRWLSVGEPGGPVEADVRPRYRHRGARARVTPLPGARCRVEFEGPERALTPGQAAVFYEGEVVLGGGWISRVLS